MAKTPTRTTTTQEKPLNDTATDANQGGEVQASAEKDIAKKVTEQDAESRLGASGERDPRNAPNPSINYSPPNSPDTDRFEHPNQKILSDDEMGGISSTMATVNQPRGSEPANVDVKTGDIISGGPKPVSSDTWGDEPEKLGFNTDEERKDGKQAEAEQP